MSVADALRGLEAGVRSAVGEDPAIRGGVHAGAHPTFAAALSPTEWVAVNLPRLDALGAAVSEISDHDERSRAAAVFLRLQYIDRSATAPFRAPRLFIETLFAAAVGDQELLGAQIQEWTPPETTDDGLIAAVAMRLAAIWADAEPLLTPVHGLGDFDRALLATLDAIVASDVDAFRDGRERVRLGMRRSSWLRTRMPGLAKTSLLLDGLTNTAASVGLPIGTASPPSLPRPLIDLPGALAVLQPWFDGPALMSSLREGIRRHWDSPPTSDGD